MPRTARPLLCYDGSAAAQLGGGWDAARFAETAVVLIEDFLTTEELAEVVATCDLQTCPLPLGSHSVIDSAVEDRIAKLVGIPVSPGTDETPLMMTHEPENITKPSHEAAYPHSYGTLSTACLRVPPKHVARHRNTRFTIAMAIHLTIPHGLPNALYAWPHKCGSKLCRRNSFSDHPARQEQRVAPEHAP